MHVPLKILAARDDRRNQGVSFLDLTAAKGKRPLTAMALQPSNPVKHGILASECPWALNYLGVECEKLCVHLMQPASPQGNVRRPLETT